MVWSNRPRGRAKRRAWLKRYVVVLQKRLKAGFCEAWLYPRSKRAKVRHWTVAAQEKDCRAKLAAAQKELEALTAA